MLNIDSTKIVDPVFFKKCWRLVDKDLRTNKTNNTAYNTHHANFICRTPNAPDKHNKSKNVE